MKKLLPVVLLFIIACSGGVKNDTPLPDSIQSMVLQKVTQGQKADKAITELHHKQVTDAKNYIGEYKGDKYDAKLYLTEYDNTDSAIADLDSMAGRIMNPHIGGQMGFQHVRQLPSLGDHVYMTLQGKRAHFFYVKGNGLYWLDVDPHMAMNSIKQLLGKTS